VLLQRPCQPGRLRRCCRCRCSFAGVFAVGSGRARRARRLNRAPPSGRMPRLRRFPRRPEGLGVCHFAHIVGARDKVGERNRAPAAGAASCRRVRRCEERRCLDALDFGPQWSLLPVALPDRLGPQADRRKRDAVAKSLAFFGPQTGGRWWRSVGVPFDAGPSFGQTGDPRPTLVSGWNQTDAAPNIRTRLVSGSRLRGGSCGSVSERRPAGLTQSSLAACSAGLPWQLFSAVSHRTFVRLAFVRVVLGMLQQGPAIGGWRAVWDGAVCLVDRPVSRQSSSDSAALRRWRFPVGRG